MSLFQKKINVFFKKLWPRKVGLQFALFVSFLLALSMTGFSLYSIQEQVKSIRSNMQLQATVLANTIAATSADLLLIRDYTSIEQLLLRSIMFPGILSIQLSDDKGKLVGDVLREEGDEPKVKYGQPILIVPNTQSTQTLFNDKTLIVWQPVILGELIGWVNITYSLSSIDSFQKDVIKRSVLQGLIIIIIAVLLLLIYLRRSTKTIESYTDFADNLNKIKGEKVLVSKTSIELEHLGRALNSASDSLYEQSLRVSTAMNEMERLAAFPESNPNIVLSVNEKGEVQYLNPYGKNLIANLGVLQSEMHALLPGNIKNIICDCINNNETIHSIESTYQERTFFWTFAPVLNQKVAHGYALEITQRKKALEQAHLAMLEKISAEEESLAKSTFLANMSHEIRTPLTAIIGFSELLLDTSQTIHERVKSINTIIRSGKHLMQIINDILDLSKIEADKLDVEQLSVSPFEILSDVNSFVSLLAEEKGLLFDIEYDFPIPEVIVSDPVRLKQVVINLCSNAIKFTEKGGVHVKVSFNNAQLNFDVVDTGIGLSNEQMVKIFNPFTQADTSTTREYGGTGLGLHLSKQLAKRLGGDITVKSTFGVGSCFSLTVTTGKVDENKFLLHLPVEKQESTQEIINENNSQVFGVVLLAEDNSDNQRLVSMFLNKMGADVVVVNNGEEAIEKTMGNDFDLILMDMQMPVMNGIDATIRLREMNYKKPIVALTANAMKEDVNACYKAGCDDFIQKPISQQKFKDTIIKFLKPARETHENHTPLISSLLIDEPDMVDLVERFINRLPSYIDNIVKNSEAYNWDEVSRFTHDLKGTSGNYGFEELYNLMQDIEFELTKENYKEIPSITNQLHNMYKRIQLGL